MKTAFVAILLGLAAIAAAKYREGSIKDNGELHYLSRFTFSVSQQNDPVAMNLWYCASQSTANSTYFAFYFDTTWESVFHKDSLTCQEKLAGASRWYPMVAGRCNSTSWINHEVPVSDSIRPHVWYVALLNCAEPMTQARAPIDVSWRLHFINVDGSEVGYDENGLKALYACFFVFFLATTVVHCFGDVFLWLRNSFHHIVRLLLATLVLMTFSNMFYMIHWAEYEGDGVGCPGCTTFAGLLDNSAYIVFTLLLTTIASGWAITNQTLTRKWWILGLFAADAIAILILFIINQSGSEEDKAATINSVWIHSESFGVAMTFFSVVYLLAWLCTLAYFVFAVYTSYRDETQYDKRLFYLVFGGSYFVWCIVVPIFSLISLAIDTWLRARMVAAIHEVITFVGIGILVVLLWPTFVYKYFRIISPDLLTDNPSGL